MTANVSEAAFGKFINDFGLAKNFTIAIVNEVIVYNEILKATDLRKVHSSFDDIYILLSGADGGFSIGMAGLEVLSISEETDTTDDMYFTLIVPLTISVSL